MAWLSLGWVWFSFLVFWGVGSNLNFFLYLSFSLVYPRLHTKNLLCSERGSVLKVCVGGWVVVESEFSDRLWLSFSLALAKPNKIYDIINNILEVGL